MLPVTFLGSKLMNTDLGGVPVTDIVGDCLWCMNFCIRHRRPGGVAPAFLSWRGKGFAGSKAYLGGVK